MNRQGKVVNLFLLILVNLMWATQVPVIRFIGDRLGPVTIAFVPMIVSTVLLVPLLWIERRKNKTLPRRTFRDIKRFTIPGLVGVFLMQYLYTVGSTLTLAANAGIITLTIPVLVVIIASLYLNEKLNVVRIAGFIIAIAGVLLTSMSDFRTASFSESQYLLGNIIFLFACCCCAVYNTYCKMLVDYKYTPLEIFVYSSLIGSVACIPLLIWVEPFSLSRILNAGTIALVGLLELSIIVYGVSMLLFFRILKDMHISQAILANYLLPFFIAILGIILLDEQITLRMLIGGGVIIISTLMVTVYENKLLKFIKGGIGNNHTISAPTEKKETIEIH